MKEKGKGERQEEGKRKGRAGEEKGMRKGWGRRRGRGREREG